MEQIKTCLAAVDIPVSDEQLSQLEAYYRMVTEKNKVMNLTAITERGDFILLHYLDSLAPLYAGDGLQELLGVKGAEERKVSLIDVGTGAGFPGIPLKIICPGLNITLLDSLRKRVLFLEDVIRELSLTGISAIHSRAEDAGRDPGLREHFDIAVSRAVANLSVLSEYTLPFVKKGGTFLAYKSGEAGAEIEASSHALKILGGRLGSVTPVTLPGSDVSRTLIQIRKVHTTPKPYPRKAGTAKNSPL